MVPFKPKYSISTAQFTLKITMEVDVLAHFDHWQREGLDEDYEDQNAWPVVVRRARLISAVDYLQVTQIHFGGLHYILKTSFVQSRPPWY